MMEAPLRAFVMMRSSDGTWTVTVCRDLGAVVRTWKSRRVPEQDVAVLHVGFDRLPSRSFDQVADEYPGCMLLTAAAKHVLPNSFVASVTPVGVLDSTEVFIGLQGWGYTLDEPTALTDQLESRLLDAVERKPQGWIALFLRDYPADAETFSARGIFDDASYLDREVQLERSVRHRAGVFRAHHIFGANGVNPCALARAAPPWLLERELASLELPVRADNVFRVSGIKTVRDLADWSPEELLNQQNFGRKSLGDAFQALTVALNDGPFPTTSVEALAESGRLLTEIRKSLLPFPERERDVLVRRMGFERTPETLQEVADVYGVSRERIRQIEASATKKWMRESSWDDILEQKITRMLIGRNFPLPVAGIEAIDLWFEGVSSNQEFLKNLVRMICKERIHFIDVDGLCYFSFMNKETWERTIAEAASMLSSGAGQEWSEDYARSLVQGLLPGAAKEFSSPLWQAASRLCHFSENSDGTRILTSYGRGAEQLVEAILAESDMPLHYTEIVKRAGHRDGIKLDPRRAHNAAASIGLLFARGTYGLRKHVPLDDEKMSLVRSEAEDVVGSEEMGRQWHTSELLSEVSERLGDEIGYLDKYILEIILRDSSVLTSLGKMVWADLRSDSAHSKRVELHQAIVRLVKEGGRPLTTNEIKQRLLAVRGINEHFQIVPAEPLVRVRAGLWGLRDRDVPISHDQQLRLIDELTGALGKKGSGLHVTEISGFIDLNGCPPEAFVSIAKQDERLKIAKGGYVYLAQWEGCRRATVSDAMRRVLDEAGAPLSVEQIHSQVETILERSCSRTLISSSLQSLDAVRDDKTGLWFRSVHTSYEEPDSDAAHAVL